MEQVTDILKLGPQFAAFPGKEFDTLCHKVNECCWEKIVANLTDQRMSEIDARRLTVPQLYQAKSIDWCLQLNDTLRRKGKRIGEPMYPPEKFDNIFQIIIESGIMEDIDHNPSLAAGIGGRLQSAMVRYCRSRYQPY